MASPQCQGKHRSLTKMSSHSASSSRLSSRRCLPSLSTALLIHAYPCPSAQPKLHKHLAEAGATYNRMYAAVPVCCPSRSALFSGRFQHNNFVFGNSVGANCSSLEWQKNIEPESFVTYLQHAGYATSFAGELAQACSASYDSPTRVARLSHALPRSLCRQVPESVRRARRRRRGAHPARVDGLAGAGR